MADVRTDMDDLLEAMTSAMDQRQAEMWQLIPVNIDTYDNKKVTCVANPMVKATVRKSDGSEERVKLPQLQDAMVVFPHGGGHTLTFPIKPKDEGIAMIMNRSIDEWYEKSGEQNQVSSRMHDLSDAVILVGLHTKPKVEKRLKNVSADSTQLRYDDEDGKLKHFFDVHPKNGMTHSVDEGKHVTTTHPENGTTISVDNGKHVTTLHPKNGISHKSSVKVHLDAPEGTMKFAKKLTIDSQVAVTKQLQANGLKSPLIQSSPGIVPDVT